MRRLIFKDIKDKGEGGEGLELLFELLHFQYLTEVMRVFKD